MSYPKILDEAARELEAAAAYLEAERPGTGRMFMRAYENKLRLVLRFPQSGRLVANTPPGHVIRSFLIPRFRYLIVVGFVEGAPTILAVAHTSRKPDYWRSRLS